MRQKSVLSTLKLLVFCCSGVICQFPRECVKNVDWTMQGRRSCCPNNCGGPTRGTCEDLENGTDGQYEAADRDLQGKDDRHNWPHVFFQRGCKCKGNFMGVDCGECKWGYTGENCELRKMLVRQNVKHLTDAERRQYFETVAKAKKIISDTNVVVAVSEDIIHHRIDYPFISMTEYNVFAWVHYYSTRDTRLDLTGEPGEFSNINDFAHEGSGFLTWHRAFLLLWEQMLQRVSGNYSMTIPYWDWQDEKNCSICTNDFVGEMDQYTGELSPESYFSDWEMICWDFETHYKNKLICNGTNEGKIKRFPGTKGLYPYLPTSEDVKNALMLKDYDTHPYNITASNSFRNALEGFLNLNTFQRLGDQEPHPLHNHVHLYLGDNATMFKVPPAANDPIFLLHHCFVDNIFEKWFSQHDVSRLPPYPERGASIGHNLREAMIPFFPVITHEGMYKVASELGYEYEDIPRVAKIRPNAVVQMNVNLSYYANACPSKANGGYDIVNNTLHNEFSTYDFNTPTGCSDITNCRFEFLDITCVDMRSLTGRRKRDLKSISHYFGYKEHVFKTLLNQASRNRRSRVLRQAADQNYLMIVQILLLVDMDDDVKRDQDTRIAESKHTLLALTIDLEIRFTDQSPGHLTLEGKISGFTVTHTVFPFLYNSLEGPVVSCPIGHAYNANTFRCVWYNPAVRPGSRPGDRATTSEGGQTTSSSPLDSQKSSTDLAISPAETSDAAVTRVNQTTPSTPRMQSTPRVDNPFTIRSSSAVTVSTTTKGRATGGDTHSKKRPTTSTASRHLPFIDSTCILVITIMFLTHCFWI